MTYLLIYFRLQVNQPDHGWCSGWGCAEWWEWWDEYAPTQIGFDGDNGGAEVT